MNHYDYLNKHFELFLDDIFNNNSKKNKANMGLIVSHGDKCDAYKDAFFANGIPFERGVALYLLTYIRPFSESVRKTDKGWIPPIHWIIKNYKNYEPVFEKIETKVMQFGKFDKAIEEHQLWLKDRSQGKQLDLTSEYISYHDFSNADLSFSILYGANLDEVNFSGCNLKGTNLSYANVVDCNFTGANLEGANLEEVIFSGCNFTGANLANTNLTGSILEFSNFNDADFTGATLNYVKLNNSEFITTKGIDAYIIQGMMRSDGFIFYLTYFDEIRIQAGCRNFTPNEASRHWGSESLHLTPKRLKLNAESIAIIDSLWIEAKERGWIS